MDGIVIHGPAAAPMRELRGPNELAPLQPGFGGGSSPLGGGFEAQLQNALNGDAVSSVASPADSIAGALQRGINAVNGEMETADAAAQSFVRGDDTSVHEVMMAMTKADTSFRFMTTIGRKVIEAYQDVMRMQV